MHYLTSAIVCITLLLAAAAAADDASDLQRLHRNFENLHRSLQNRGGISPGDAAAIDRLREKFASYNAANEATARSLAGELQLSAWLEDHDRVDELFEQLLRLDPDQPGVGDAWASYFERLDQQDRVDEIYTTLLQIAPDSKDVRISQARRLRQRNEYAAALDMLNELSPSDAESPEAVMLRSECLYADHRFEEAVAALHEIPEEVLQEQPRLRRQIEQALELRESYVELWAQELAIREAEATADLPRAEIVTERGSIIVELFEDNAPNTVANFITLAESGFYDGTTFHRVLPNFMAQGGDPNTKPDGTGTPGSGGPGYVIADEWEREDARKHFAGTLAMANSGPNSAGSQFYITHQPVNHLNQGYTAFGRVLEGLELVRSIKKDDRIEAVRVLTKRDHEYEVVHYTAPPQSPPNPMIPEGLSPELLEQVEQKLRESQQTAPPAE